MRLFFDARFIRTDRHDGISRYSFELAQRVSDHHDDVTYIIHGEKQRNFLPSGAKTIILNNPESVREAWSGRALAKHQPDVVFSPMQTLRGHRSYKLVLTLHDTIYYRHKTPPANHPAWVRLGWRLFHATPLPQRMALNSADHVVTVSHKSKHEIEDMRLTKRPVSVAYNAPGDLSRYLNDPVATTSVDNLVYMGSFVPYKNVETLVRAMRYLPGKTLHLLSKITPEQRKNIEQLFDTTYGKVIFHGGVSDQKYAELLANNAALVSASKDEGFGLPLVEAMSLGVPVVASDEPAHREVAGDAALYFKTTSARDLADKVKQIEDDKLRAELIKKGKKQAAKFNWDDSAKTIVKIAKELHRGKE
ncbi:MAG: glycosyltransferase family 4 protein [Candidatus Nomurabacteria bacterium]|jgi:glycosyltransferase involved in cell wall biosynthesis|nr:glycosyltransferase family 4 protein [Candidatus Nomurabacteria bacterium]